jgi:hypothetical protein
MLKANYVPHTSTYSPAHIIPRSNSFENTVRKTLDLPVVGLLGVVNLDLLRSLLQADVSHSLGVHAVEDLGDLFEGEALGFWEHEVDPDGLDEVPKLETQLVF